MVAPKRKMPKVTVALARTMLAAHARALLIIVLTSAYLVTILYAHTAKAEAVLYPRTCLGGWKDPANASGLPDVIDNDPAKYSHANSASVSDTLADLFCGDFSGEIPKDTKPTAIVVKFSWALVPKSAPVVISAVSSTLASSTDAVLDAPADAVGIAVSTSTATTTIATTTDIQEHQPETVIPATSTPLLQIHAASLLPDFQHSASSSDSVFQVAAPSPIIDISAAAPSDPAPASAPTSTPADAPASLPPSDPAGPQSLLSLPIFAWFAPQKAYAQEATSTSVSTTSDAISATTTTTIATSTLSITEDAVLEVSYTLDGSTWHVLGTVTRFDLARSSFTIPIDNVSAWGDVQKIQIRVRTLSSVSDFGTIYVDGMTLAVAYDKNREVKDDVPTPRPLQEHDTIPERDSPAIIVHPSSTASSTRVIFYKVYPDGSTEYVAETDGHGDAPLSEYYAPPPPPGKYSMIEYKNDGGAFECNGFSASVCEHNPHFIRRVDFEITASSSDAILTQ